MNSLVRASVVRGTLHENFGSHKSCANKCRALNQIRGRLSLSWSDQKQPSLQGKIALFLVSHESLIRAHFCLIRSDFGLAFILGFPYHGFHPIPIPKILAVFSDLLSRKLPLCKSPHKSYLSFRKILS